MKIKRRKPMLLNKTKSYFSHSSDMVITPWLKPCMLYVTMFVDLVCTMINLDNLFCLKFPLSHYHSSRPGWAVDDLSLLSKGTQRRITVTKSFSSSRIHDVDGKHNVCVCVHFCINICCRIDKILKQIHPYRIKHL